MPKTRQSTVISDSQVTEGYEDAGGIFSYSIKGIGQELDDCPVESDGEEVFETGQGVWDILREEFYEHIEQLPLSLRRSFALIGEQDSEVQAHQTELFPTIRTYVKLRHSGYIEPTASNKTDQQDADTSKRIDHLNAVSPGHKIEDIDLTMEDAEVEISRSRSHMTPNEKFSAKVTASPHSTQSDRSRGILSSRVQALRESDASVPKSVPFPSRSKPISSKELLPRISFLMAEILRASEEKVGLASAAYDTVDRHVRALDVAIKEMGGCIASGQGEEDIPVVTPRKELVDQITYEAPIANEELQGEAPVAEHLAEGGRTVPSTRKSRKRDLREIHEHTDQSTAGQEQEVAPAEPRYCYCNQVSYGEMIACDSPDCSREWFHLGCVGLAAPPKGKGKWYCRDCEEVLQRNKRRRLTNY